MASIKLVVMSDSHGDRGVVEMVKSHYLGQVDGIFHNGDSELPSSDPIWSGVYVVQGNCDYDDGYQATAVVDLGTVRVAQTHGHLHAINFLWDRLVYFAEEAGADICLYGHLHRAAAWQEGKTVFVNPGSVSQPRGDVQEKLYALIEADETRIRVDFYDLTHQIYPELSKEFSR